MKCCRPAGAQVQISKKDYAKEELLQSFRARDSTRYLVALQLANDAEVEPEDIPCVYSLHRLSQTFQVPDIDVNVLSVKAQLCFVLDYTSSMKTQVAQAKTSVARMIEAVRNMVREKVIETHIGDAEYCWILVVYLSFISFMWFSLALPSLVHLLKKACF